MRDTFVTNLAKLAQHDEKIFLVCGDLGFNVLEEFRDLHPKRFLNGGISEQNIAGLCAGLSREGYTVYFYSIGNFPTLRCMEQIRYDIAYHNANVNIVAVGGGYAYGSLGTSHHATEEIGMLRMIPNMMVTSPSDPSEVKDILDITSKDPSPSYMRLNRSGEGIINYLNPFSPGDLHLAYSGSDQKKKAFVSNGAICFEIYKDLVAANGSADLFSLPIVKPLEEERIFNQLVQYNEIIVVEEHQLNGGLGSTIQGIICDSFSTDSSARMPKIHRIGIQDSFQSLAGSQDFLREKAGLFNYRDYL
ncbi:MAG TPA: transketolase [Methylophilaceae bacterium]|jgi:transketolase|nr:transketolase [Methylophilaceae bacterium]